MCLGLGLSLADLPWAPLGSVRSSVLVQHLELKAAARVVAELMFLPGIRILSLHPEHAQRLVPDRVQRLPANLPRLLQQALFHVTSRDLHPCL